MRKLAPIGAVATWAALAGTFAMAPLAEAVAAERDASGVIEEIIVTSRRTDESLQDVPVSVTAFTEDDIARVAPRSLRDFDGLMPNVFIGMNTAGPSAGSIFIRGLGYADIEKTQASAVGVIVDGLFQPSSTGQLIDTFDIEQIEVNRGPQGVLFGKNTTGGTIVATRVKPNTDRFGFNAAAQVGRYGEWVYKARMNVPVSDTFAVKIGGTHKISDGYYDNITQGGSAGEVDYGSYTVSALWTPTDNITAQLTYDRIDDESDIPPQDPRYNGPDPYVNEADFDEFTSYEVDSFGLQVEYATDMGTLSSITGIVTTNDTVGQDFDGSTKFSTAVPLVQLHTLRAQDYDSFSQELRWAGDINDQWSYQVGAFYMETELDFQQGTNQILQLPPVALGLEACIPGVIPPNPNTAALCQVGPLYSVQKSSEDTESLGYFANLTWQATDKLELSAGARYIKDDKDFGTAFFTGVPVTGDALAPPTRGQGNANLSVPESGDSWNDTIYKFTASYMITDANNVYASYSQGFRSGGFSMRGIDPRFQTYDPETVDAWEVGSKNEFLDGRLRVNLAAFATLLEGAQFSSVLTDSRAGGPGTNTIVNNANGDIEIQGVEAEITALLSENFTLILAGGYQDDKSDEFEISSERVAGLNPVTGTGCNPSENAGFFPNAPAFSPNSCPLLTVGGGALGRTPEWNWATTLVYSKEFGANYFTASVTAKATDDWVISGGATSTNPEYEDGVTLIDARVSYEFALQDERNVVLSLIGKNLTDEEYREQTLPLGANGGFQGWAPPMTWAVEVVWNN